MTADNQDVCPHRQTIDVIAEIWLRSGHFEDATHALKLVGEHIAEHGAEKTRDMLLETPEDMGIRPRSERPSAWDVMAACATGSPMPREYIPGESRAGAWLVKHPEILKTVHELVRAMSALTPYRTNAKNESHKESGMTSNENRAAEIWRLCLKNRHPHAEKRARTAIKAAGKPLETFRWIVGSVAATLSFFSEKSGLAPEFNREALRFWAMEWRKQPHPGDDNLRSTGIGLLIPSQLVGLAKEVPVEKDRVAAYEMVRRLAPFYERAAYAAGRKLDDAGYEDARQIFNEAVSSSQRASADALTGIRWIKGDIHPSQRRVALELKEYVPA